MYVSMYDDSKVADDVWEDIAAALNTIMSTTDKSGNMKKELKNTISETVSTLRKLLVKLKPFPIWKR